MYSATQCLQTDEESMHLHNGYRPLLDEHQARLETYATVGYASVGSLKVGSFDGTRAS